MKGSPEKIARKAYVVGFMFNTEAPTVVLIHKARPEWQRGKINGVGGKIEPGETARDAMAREFQEETGLTTSPEDWAPFCKMYGGGPGKQDPEPWEVYFFKAKMDLGEWTGRYHVDEPVRVYNVNAILFNQNLIPNLRWLIPMALDPMVALVRDGK